LVRCQCSYKLRLMVVDMFAEPLQARYDHRCVAGPSSAENAAYTSVRDNSVSRIEVLEDF
jgi:hypothetical protein